MSASVPDSQATDNGGPTTMHRFAGGATGVTDPTTGGRLYSSYGANDWIYRATTIIQSRPTEEYWGSLSAARRPTETPLMADAMWRGGGPMTSIANKHARPALNGEWDGTDKDMKHYAMHRHAKGINMTFFDGSARRVRPKQLWSLQWHKSFDVNYVNSQPPSYYPAWMR